MKDTMEESEVKNNFLIDGFPRNQNNMDGWNSAMGDKSNLRFVLFFDCSEEVVEIVSFWLILNVAQSHEFACDKATLL